ncbi:hypothetical protein quinque_015814 [Culex quinquefasciatus]
MCDQAKPRKKKEKFQYNKSIMAATSVVVLDRGNNTTCTINLHEATLDRWECQHALVTTRSPTKELATLPSASGSSFLAPGLRWP